MITSNDTVLKKSFSTYGKQEKKKAVSGEGTGNGLGYVTAERQATKKFYR
jgi:hypothetical protein